MPRGRRKKTSYKLTRQQKIYGVAAVIVILGILAMAGAYLIAGTPIYTAEDYSTAAAWTYNATGDSLVATTLADVHEKGGVLYFTPADPVCKLTITYKKLVDDFKDKVNQLNLDLSDVETSKSPDKIKVAISDGTNTRTIGTVESMAASQISIDESDWDALTVESQNLQLIITFYNDTGGYTNVTKADVESGLATDWVIAGGMTSFYALLSNGVIALVVAFRKAMAAITSTISSFLMALVTNQVVLIFGVGLAVLVIVFVWREKGKFF